MGGREASRDLRGSGENGELASPFSPRDQRGENGEIGEVLQRVRCSARVAKVSIGEGGAS